MTRPSIDSYASATPLLTLFTVLKPFEGESGVHQRNAIESWAALAPDVELLLFTDTQIPADLRGRFRCYEITAQNEHGTPLLNEVFEVAARDGRGRLRAYLNGDIVIDHRFVDAARKLRDSGLGEWLAIGQRTEFPAPDTRQHVPPAEWVEDSFRRMDQVGQKASILCKDYFVFTPGLFREIPPFAVGRGNWDSWMVHHCKQNGVPVVDIGPVTPVIHPRHGYGHVDGGRLSAYVTGAEARENERLAGGHHFFSGSTATVRLTRKGLRRVRLPGLAFIMDFTRYRTFLYGVTHSRSKPNRVDEAAEPR